MPPGPHGDSATDFAEDGKLRATGVSVVGPLVILKGRFLRCPKDGWTSCADYATPAPAADDGRIVKSRPIATPLEG